MKLHTSCYAYLFLAANEYIDGKILHTAEDVLKAVSVIIASELCMEPNVRAAAKVYGCMYACMYICLCIDREIYVCV